MARPSSRPTSWRAQPSSVSKKAAIGSTAAATVSIGDTDVAVVSVHLESHSDPSHRAEQMSVLLDAV
jgi:hypothetical protein